MIRTALKVAAYRYALAQGQDVAQIKRAVREAARSGGDFVDVTVAGNEMISVLVTPGVALLFETREFFPEDDAVHSNASERFDLGELDF